MGGWREHVVIIVGSLAISDTVSLSILYSLSSACSLVPPCVTGAGSTPGRGGASCTCDDKKGEDCYMEVTFDQTEHKRSR